MSSIAIAAGKPVGTPVYVLDYMAMETELRPTAYDDALEEYEDVVRLVFHRDIQTLVSFSYNVGWSGMYTIQMSFNGTTLTVEPPAGFGPFCLVRQELDVLEAEGSDFLRVTWHSVSKLAADNEATQNLAKWTTDGNWQV